MIGSEDGGIGVRGEMVIGITLTFRKKYLKFRGEKCLCDKEPPKMSLSLFPVGQLLLVM